MSITKNPMVGKTIRLFPSDTYKKIAFVKEIDHLGFTLEIIQSEDSYYKVGGTFFINHAKPIIFQILD